LTLATCSRLLLASMLDVYGFVFLVFCSDVANLGL
jgi:hypothetical protein